MYGEKAHLSGARWSDGMPWIWLQSKNKLQT